MAHSYTAVRWVLGLYNDLKLKDKTDHIGHVIMRGGLFNVNYRSNREDLWVQPDEVDKFYFKMFLLRRGQQPEEV